MRNTIAAIVLGVYPAAFIAALWFAVTTNGLAVLIAAAVAIASFGAAAWAAGKIHRTRAITPEAIIRPNDEADKLTPRIMHGHPPA